MDQVRVRLHLLPSHQQQPVISRLVQEHRRTVNITGAQLGSLNPLGWIGLELRGSTKQIANGLAFLSSMDLQIKGKPNAMGDGWHY